MSTSIARRLDALAPLAHDAVESWKNAWADFWRTVDRAEPEAAAAMAAAEARLFAGFTRAEVERLAEGPDDALSRRLRDAEAAHEAAADAAFETWKPALEDLWSATEGGPDAAAAWWSAMNALPVPDMNAPDFTLWPHTVPLAALPPQRPDLDASTQTFFRARLAEAVPESGAEAAAVACLLHLAYARTLAALTA